MTERLVFERFPKWEPTIVKLNDKVVSHDGKEISTEKERDSRGPEDGDRTSNKDF